MSAQDTIDEIKGNGISQRYIPNNQGSAFNE
jgi:hypothetical protein